MESKFFFHLRAQALRECLSVHRFQLSEPIKHYLRKLHPICGRSPLTGHGTTSYFSGLLPILLWAAPISGSNRRPVMGSLSRSFSRSSFYIPRPACLPTVGGLHT